MDGTHVQGMAQDEVYMFSFTQIRQPVPGKHTLDTDNKIVPIRLDGMKKSVRTGSDIFVKDDLSILTQDAEIHIVCMQIDSTVKIVLFDVKLHEKASFV